MSVFYDNRSYWTNLHEKFKGELRAVGHPFLSESMNQLKYESEAESVLIGMKTILDSFKQRNRTKLSALDVGAGYGYWTGLVYGLFSNNGFTIDISALDLSTEALEVIQERLPYVNPIHADLQTIVPNHPQKAKADPLDFQSFRGNGIPRHLFFIDDILAGLGLRRCLVLPAVFFLLNENIEAPNKLSCYTMTIVWKLMCRLDRIENFVHKTAHIFKYLDFVLKRHSLAFSSSVCVYQKVDADKGLSLSI